MFKFLGCKKVWGNERIMVFEKIQERRWVK